MEVLPIGIVYGISLSTAGFLVGLAGAIAVIVGQPIVYSGFVFFPSWYTTYRALRSYNASLMHSKERRLLIQTGSRMVRDKLYSELTGTVFVTEADPTKSPFIEEARRCISYYIRL